MLANRLDSVSKQDSREKPCEIERFDGAAPMIFLPSAGVLNLNLTLTWIDRHFRLRLRFENDSNDE